MNAKRYAETLEQYGLKAVDWNEPDADVDGEVVLAVDVHIQIPLDGTTVEVNRVEERGDDIVFHHYGPRGAYSSIELVVADVRRAFVDSGVSA